MAEQVDDPALCAAMPAAPRMVVRLSRGTRDEQIAALPKEKTTAAADAGWAKSLRAGESRHAR